METCFFFHPIVLEEQRKEGLFAPKGKRGSLLWPSLPAYTQNRTNMTQFKNNNNGVTFIGETDFRNIRKRFGIKQKNRTGHMYCVGRTGTGKSTLLLNMVVSDIREGKGLALIDPHGDLAESILDCVPKRRIDDVIYFNPADLERPVPLNPLVSVHSEQRHLVVSGLISVFKKVWYEFWGPRLEHILRHCLFTLLARPGSTLLDIPRLLTDKLFRAEILKTISDPHLRDFWFLEFEKYSAWLRSDATSPILNKVGQFLMSLPIRNIVGQAKNTFFFRKVMDEGKILIANLSKGKIGEDACSLLGAMLVTRVQLAALSRANIPEEKRKPFYLYVDEIHNFLTLSFADILSESRKYGLNLILSHQYLAQLDERIRSAIFGNVGTLISFRVGQEDAQILAREFHPVFAQEDLVNLGNYHIYLKLMIDGKTSRAFSAMTLAPPDKKTSYKDEVVLRSRDQYGKPTHIQQKHSSCSFQDKPGPPRLPFAPVG
jgi:hypothetical protein